MMSMMDEKPPYRDPDPVEDTNVAVMEDPLVVDKPDDQHDGQATGGKVFKLQKADKDLNDLAPHNKDNKESACTGPLAYVDPGMQSKVANETQLKYPLGGKAWTVQSGHSNADEHQDHEANYKECANISPTEPCMRSKLANETLMQLSSLGDAGATVDSAKTWAVDRKSRNRAIHAANGNMSGPTPAGSADTQPPKPPKRARPDDAESEDPSAKKQALREFLGEKLEQYVDILTDKLGVGGVEELADVEKEDLENVGLKPVQKNQLWKAIQQPGPSLPSGPPPGELWHWNENRPTAYTAVPVLQQDAGEEDVWHCLSSGLLTTATTSTDPDGALLQHGGLFYRLLSKASQQEEIERQLERRRPPSIHMSQLDLATIDRVTDILQLKLGKWEERMQCYTAFSDPRQGTGIPEGREVAETPTVIKQMQECGFGGWLASKGWCLRNALGCKNLLDYAMPSLDVKGTTDVVVVRKAAKDVPLTTARRDIVGCIELKTVVTFKDTSSVYQAFLQLWSASTQGEVPTVQGLTDGRRGYVFYFDLANKTVRQISCVGWRSFLSQFYDSLCTLQKCPWTEVPKAVWNVEPGDKTFLDTLPSYLHTPFASRFATSDEPATMMDYVAEFQQILNGLGLETVRCNATPMTAEALAKFA